MLICRVFSRLLDYPTEQLHAYADELRSLVETAESVPGPVRQNLLTFLEGRLSQDLLDWQSDYDGLFERGRSVSLHLFEHVHGESRDRGQAMVDLMAQYRQAGLELNVNELPDYLPLYLEFVATQGEGAVAWLQDVAHVLALLAARLQERESDYALVVEALLQLAGSQVDLAPLREEVAREERDDTPEALDKIWEEEMVSFATGDPMGQGSSCGTASYRPTPAQRQDDVMAVQWVEPSLAEASRR